MAVSTKVVKDAKPKKKKAANRVLFWSAECKYSVIIDRVNELDWKLVDDEKQENKCNVFWIDVASIQEHFKTIQPWQTINHFPGMPNVARKKLMGQNLNRLLKVFPKEYSFYPRTWILPGEMADFRNQFDSSGNSIGNKIFIIKPDAGCQGRGIYLTKTFEKVPLNENVVAQLYIKKPLLIDNYKFDLRLYCLVTSVKPLRVYLFHDGLVRMCTEEYVKPNKQNLDQSCMHLTNYAVNKHNENFLQPGTDEGDSGSKRSLQWFMDWVRADHGDAKADWLWNRMGVLCMRTLLSILPVLSKQYDEHFRLFNNVPIDLRKMATSSAYAPQPSGGLPGSANEPSRGARMQGRSSSFKESSGGNKTTSESGEENSSSEENKQGRGGTANGSREANNDNGQSHSAEQESDGEGGGEDEGGLKMRGSRCFEVLGYDVMIDANLNPWIIEVNHLPSFGTDSALDRDIKERLMEQVFSVLPARPDDQQAYALHHKYESEKRLVAQSRVAAALAKKEKEDKAAKERAKPPLRPREPKPLASKNDAAAAEAVAKAEADKAREDAARAAEAGEDSEDIIDEECTPERLLEIKAILYDIYQKYSQEKLNKIDRLLAKYVQHEEEFLRFVYNKYSVPPAMYKNFLEKQRLAAEAAAAGEDQSPVDANSPGSAESSENAVDGEPSDRAQTAESNAEDGGNDTADESGENTKQDLNVDTSESANTAHGGPKTESNTSRNQNRETSKRASRSMSPPRSQSLAGSNGTGPSSRRAWKNTEQEDALLREQVLAIHVPKEDDEWLLFETSKLTQFTRIFPLPKATASESSSGSAKAGIATEDQLESQPDEQEDGEEGEDGKEGTNAKEGGKEAVKAAKSATYEEIIFQTFLADKRQTSRMTCPLAANRVMKIDDNVSSFLPPLDGPSTSRSTYSSLGSGKGAVGWKAPPKPARETVVIKQPTQVQTESAKRLSQGLSVKSDHTNRHRYISQNHLNVPNALANTGYSVVLDPHEYQQLGQPGAGGMGAGMQMQAPNGATAGGTAGIGNAYIPVYGGVYPTFSKELKSEVVWPSTKANRLLEESRINRMRLEAAKATSAAVVRQQVFYFDPNYRDQMGNGSGTDGLTLIPPTGAQGTSASTGGLLGDSQGSVMDDGGSVANSQYQPYGAGRNMYGTGAVAGGSVRARNAPPAISHNTRHASTGNINANFQAAATAYSNGTSNHTQEELLRQLFPSWF